MSRFSVDVPEEMFEEEFHSDRFAVDPEFDAVDAYDLPVRNVETSSFTVALPETEEDIPF